jgi:hypothetical protein
VGGWVVGWGEIEIKAKLSPAKAGAWAELGKIIVYKFWFLLMLTPSKPLCLYTSKSLADLECYALLF